MLWLNKHKHIVKHIVRLKCLKVHTTNHQSHEITNHGASTAQEGPGVRAAVVRAIKEVTLAFRGKKAPSGLVRAKSSL
jgi:hypothetical protein